MNHKYNFDGCGINRDGERILTLQKLEMRNDKSLADFARVAAAAPELLEALENVLCLLEDNGISPKTKLVKDAWDVFNKAKGQA